MDCIVSNQLGLNGIEIDSLKSVDMEKVCEFDKKMIENAFRSVWIKYIHTKTKTLISVEEALKDTFIFKCRFTKSKEMADCFLYDKYLMLYWLENTYGGHPSYVNKSKMFKIT